MAELQAQPQQRSLSSSDGHVSVDVKTAHSARPRNHSIVDAFSPVNNDGCFEFDRVIKSGYVQKRTQKTKKWKSIYLVLRPNTLSLYKNEQETKLRHQIYLSDLTAVTFLKDPKHKRQNVFGLFSPSRNFHFQASTAVETEEWVDLIRRDARIEEEEEEMFLASPQIRRQSHAGLRPVPPNYSLDRVGEDNERFLSSSPEPFVPSAPRVVAPPGRRKSSNMESSGLSGNELASHSDFSDNDIQRFQGASIESLAVQSLPEAGSSSQSHRPSMNIRSTSQVSVANVEQDPDRVIWQGWLWFLRTKHSVRQWKRMWAVLRPRNLILYKDESEYTARWIQSLGAIVNVVDIDPLSKSKKSCFQIITEEKSYRFCTNDEEALVQCIGAFKSLLAKRRELEARAGPPS